MRIGIDARFITHPQVGGFKTYTESLVAALGEVDEDNEYVLYTDRPPGSLAGLPCRPNFSVAVVRGSVPLAGMVWREQVKLAQQAARDRVNLLHAPCLTAPLRLACPLVVTIHDMIWNGPQWRAGSAAWSLKQRLIRSYYRAIAPGAAARASAIITVSEEAKRGIVQDLGVDSGRVFVIHEAANPRFKPASSSDVEAVRRKHHLAGAFILAFGSADPRKNLKSLLDAYALLSDELRTRHPLVIVWTHSLFSGSIKQQVEALGLGQHVRYLQNVSDEDLVLILNAASLFAFPSLQEGFGLPLLEAMACETPVVASRNSSIPEVAGDAALFFDAQDPGTLADAIVRVLTDERMRADLVARGITRAASFSWSACARQTLAVYRSVLSTLDATAA